MANSVQGNHFQKQNSNNKKLFKPGSINRINRLNDINNLKDISG